MYCAPLQCVALSLSTCPLSLSLPPSLSLSPGHTGKHVSCGYEDGGVRVWNLKECTTVSTMSPSHSGSVHCLAAHADGRLLMTGSDDSTACLVNSTTGKVTTSWAVPDAQTINILCTSPTPLHSVKILLYNVL